MSRSTASLIFICLIAAVATWLAIPSNVLNIAGLKDDIYIRQGLDLQGGLQVILETRPSEGQSVSGDALNGTRDTIERRVNSLGVAEPLVQTRGNNQIIIELPGVDDPEAAVAIVRQTALLEIIDTGGVPLAPGTRVNTSLGPYVEPGTAATPTADAGATPQASPTPTTPAAPAVEGPTYTTIIAGSDLTDAYPTQDQFGSIVVGFELSDAGSSKFYDFTSTHINQPMSIVVDKIVINTANINNAISGTGQISGLTPDEVSNLSLQLKSGALEVPLEVVQSRTVGPTLGQESIDKSILASIVGIILVAILMILYYRLPGFLSVIALLIYAAIVTSLFKIIPVTLTLAGIAGFVLSIGMAVDANVLIFSRLKDELRVGRPLRQAVEAGFDHAWPSIRDSNVSTMITCVILYWFGRYTGASIIQGFALTLFVGVIVSMFTAIVVTRTLLRVVLNNFGQFRDRWWLGVEHTSASIGVVD